jgi:hypothetical protein
MSENENKELMSANNWVSLKEQAIMLVRSGFLPVAIHG